MERERPLVARRRASRPKAFLRRPVGSGARVEGRRRGGGAQKITAAEQLRAIVAGLIAGIEIGRPGRTHDSLYSIAVGVLVAAMLGVVVYVYPTIQPWLIGPSTILYGVGIGVVGAIYRQRR